MSPVFFITPKRPQSTGKYFHPIYDGSMESALYKLPVESPCNCTTQNLATSWKILLSSICSTLTTSYTLHHEKRVIYPLNLPQKVKSLAKYYIGSKWLFTADPGLWSGSFWFRSRSIPFTNAGFLSGSWLLDLIICIWTARARRVSNFDLCTRHFRYFYHRIWFRNECQSYNVRARSMGSVRGNGHEYLHALVTKTMYQRELYYSWGRWKGYTRGMLSNRSQCNLISSAAPVNHRVPSGILYKTHKFINGDTNGPTGSPNPDITTHK